MSQLNAIRQELAKRGIAVQAAENSLSISAEYDPVLEAVTAAANDLGITDEHLVVAIFGHKGAGRQVFGLFWMVAGAIHVLVSALNVFTHGPAALLKAIPGIASFILGYFTHKWGSMAECEAKLGKEASSATASYSVEASDKAKEAAKRLARIRAAKPAFLEIKKAKPWEDPKCKARLAKKNPQLVRGVIKAIQSA